jgi:GT2 family glycosyltransferase
MHHEMKETIESSQLRLAGRSANQPEIRRGPKTPLVGIVILNFNCGELLAACIQSALDQSYSDKIVVAVDNGSDDESGDVLAKFAGKVSTVETGKNAGFAGFNLGITKALQLGCEYVMYVDSDSALDPDVVSVLVNFLEANPIVGIAGPVQYKLGSGELYYAGSMIDLRTCAIYPAKYNTVPTQCDFVGNAMMRRSLLDKTRFDENFFSYYCEVDICLRARTLGFKVYTVPAAKIFSHQGYTSNKVRGLRGYIATRNRLYLAAKYSARKYRPLVFCFAALEAITKIGYWSASKHFTNAVLVSIGFLSGLSVLIRGLEPNATWRVSMSLIRYEAFIPRILKVERYDRFLNPAYRPFGRTKTYQSDRQNRAPLP